jgi:hypothetical protein
MIAGGFVEAQTNVACDYIERLKGVSEAGTKVYKVLFINSK